MKIRLNYDEKNEKQLMAVDLFNKYNTRYDLTENETADIELTLKIDNQLKPESYKIDRSEHQIILVGADILGLLHGVGRVLHKAPDKIKSEYRVPEKRMRGIYFATHFYNYYQAAPLDKINDYLEEMVLWGCNCVCTWFDMHHFKGFNDSGAVELLERIKSIFTLAKKLGMKVYLGTLANEYYSTTPEDLLATNVIEGTEYFQTPCGYYNTEICPSVPGGEELIISSHMEVIDYFADVNLDYIHLWPYDQGGCTCEKCSPWGTNGFLKISEKLALEIRKKCPESKIILSTWRFDCFVKGEWDEFLGYLDNQEMFFDILLAELESPFVPQQVYKKAKDNGTDVIGFPEISMLTAVPWGGFGAVPVPAFIENSYKKTEMHHSGGIAYSEGIFEDINKIIILSMYFGGDTVAEVLEDYFGYYFSDDTTALCIELVKCLESSLTRSRINDKGMVDDFPTEDVVEYSPLFKIKNTECVEKALKLANEIKDRLSVDKKDSNRFRMLYLRAVIDKALVDNDGMLSDETEKASQELEKIYYAHNADYAVCPITKKAIRENRGHI